MTAGGTMLDTVQAASFDLSQRKLHILSRADGLHQDTDVFYLIGEEEDKSENKLLLKCFPPPKKSAFDNECKVLEVLSRGKNRSAVPFIPWRSKATSLNISSSEVDLQQPSEIMSILCFSFVDGISLLTWMENKYSSMSLGLVYYIAYDVINALEFLHQNGINHNDITAANILLTHGPGIPPWKAMVINFDCASLGTNHAIDLKSFGDLLRRMVQQCIPEEAEVTSPFHTWLDSTPQEKLTATLVRQQLQESLDLCFMETRL